MTTPGASEPLTTGVYNIPAPVYHADPCPAPSLSCSIAKQICLASPAHAWQQHPRLNLAAVDEECEAFDIGTAAHARLLEPNVESAVTVIDAPDWRTKAAKEARDTARAAGRVPLLAKHASAVEAMVAAARGQLDAHTDGGERMFLDGQVERTLIWQDDGVWCRARLDYLRLTGPDVAIDDYKTTSTSANPDQWSRALFQNGWDIQAAWYERAVRHVLGVADVTFRYCVQETFPPYVLSVIALAPDALVLAEKKCLYALDIWQRALASNDWPGYPRRTCYAVAPPWHEAEWLEGAALMMTWARVISLHWEESASAIQEATLEVEHQNGDRQLFVIPILRMTDRLTNEMKRQQKGVRRGL